MLLELTKTETNVLIRGLVSEIKRLDQEVHSPPYPEGHPFYKHHNPKTMELAEREKKILEGILKKVREGKEANAILQRVKSRL